MGAEFTPADLISACGGFGAALRATMTVSRALWSLCSAEPSDPPSKNVYRVIPRAAMARAVDAHSRLSRSPGAVDAVLGRALDAHLCWIDRQDPERVVFRRSVSNPLELVRVLLRDTRPDHELRFFVMQDIRRHYGVEQSSRVAHVLHTFANAVNRSFPAQASDGTPRSSLTLNLQNGLLPVLSRSSGRTSDGSAATQELFLECCRAVNYLQLADKLGHVELRTSLIDAEYILSWLFGLPTSIKGLDDLFGGGGLMLVEASQAPEDQRIGGRAVLAMGPAGTGKSLLTLQMAVEIARKGGVAWVMPLEQTAEDCLYTLESMGALDANAPMRVATTVQAALSVLEQPVDEQGALILLRTVKDNFSDFLAIFEENVRLMQRYPLRFIAVDPVSAMTQMDREVTKRRARLLRMFENVKQMGTNIWLVAEENTYSREPLYEHNIADTVIHLDVEKQYGYSQRYIEITKSRLQRELRGRHAFALGPGNGITVYPSSAAVKSRIRTRANRLPEAPTAFGLPSLDQVLGQRGLYSGDIVAIQGPGGCSKTPLGMSFLLSADMTDGDRPNRAETASRALLVSARLHEGALRHLLNNVYALRRNQTAPRSGKRPADIVTVVIGGGYVKPGFIFQQIENEFVKARLNNYSIGRVMIDNVTHWELAPYVREDEAFGETLLELLRAHRVTALLTCGESEGRDSALNRSVIDGVDCLIQCDRVEFRGSNRVMIRVLKSRDMAHQRELFELSADPGSLEVNAAPPLLRIGRNGTISPVRIRLFLHQDSPAQEVYNASIRSSLDGILSREIDIEPTPLQLGKALELGRASAVDELQVVQLDEFQLPMEDRGRTGTEAPLQMFPSDRQDPRSWSDTLSRLRSRIARSGHVIAAPYYVNVGLLAARREVDSAARCSWSALAAECERWERDHSDDLFFDFSSLSLESFNCLFFEILLSIGGKPAPPESDQGGSFCALREWITSDMAQEAMVLMHRLCRRAHMTRRAVFTDEPGGPGPRRHIRAQVSRHWYSTLNQMLAEMPAEERASIEVMPLPGGVSVAGEWYLGVPSYSAAPQVGLRIIELLTSPEAELDRVKLGIGLPTRVSFYAFRESSQVSVSPYFSMHGAALSDVVANAFPRSSFGCYPSVTATLSSHLQDLLEIPSSDERGLMNEIAKRREFLKRRLNFVGDQDRKSVV